MSERLAYLLTWTCYGTWLHGDQRGSVDDEHNVPGTAFLSTDAPRADCEKAQLSQLPVQLDAVSRRIVEETLNAHCRHRGWELLALNVRTNHVHVVVVAGDAAPERMMGQFKAWTTRRLREAGRISADARVWTRYGSKRYLWKEQSVGKAVEYVTDYQGDDLA